MTVCCRNCDEDIELSNKGIWKALCLDCASEAKRCSVESLKSDVAYWKQRAESLEQENQSLRWNSYNSYNSYNSSDFGTEDDPACCNSTIYRSNKWIWKCCCVDCADGSGAELQSMAAQVTSLKEKIEELESALSDKDDLISETEERMWEKDAARCKEITNLQGVIKRRNEEIRNLRQELQQEKDSTNAELTSAQLDRHVYQILNRRIWAEKQELNTRVTNLPREVEEARNRLEDATAAMDMLRSQESRHAKLCPAERNSAMLSASEYTDICISAGEEVFHAHRAVLSTRSPVFAAMLSNPMRESSERLFQVVDITAKGLEAFLRCLYTGSFGDSFDSNEHGTEVIAAAHKYNIPWMQEELSKSYGIPEVPTDPPTSD